MTFLRQVAAIALGFCIALLILKLLFLALFAGLVLFAVLALMAGMRTTLERRR